VHTPATAAAAAPAEVAAPVPAPTAAAAAAAVVAVQALPPELTHGTHSCSQLRQVVLRLRTATQEILRPCQYYCLEHNTQYCTSQSAQTDVVAPQETICLKQVSMSALNTILA
jgi:hypothetical protein